MNKYALAALVVYAGLVVYAVARHAARRKAPAKMTARRGWAPHGRRGSRGRWAPPPVRSLRYGPRRAPGIDLDTPPWWWHGWGAWPGWDVRPAAWWSYEYPLFYRWLMDTYPAEAHRLRDKSLSMGALRHLLCARPGMHPSLCAQ